MARRGRVKRRFEILGSSGPLPEGWVENDACAALYGGRIVMTSRRAITTPRRADRGALRPRATIGRGRATRPGRRRRVAGRSSRSSRAGPSDGAGDPEPSDSFPQVGWHEQAGNTP